VSVLAQKSAWSLACAFDELVPEWGVCANVLGEQVAIFRMADDSLHAVGNYDPFSDANVMSRGIIGSFNGVPVIASPIYKQHFSLETGACIEDEAVSLSTYECRVLDGSVYLRPRI